jgi:hypothetical protein
MMLPSSSGIVAKVKKLTRFGEDKPIIFWGKNVLLTEVLVSGKTSLGEIKNMNKMSQFHGNYSTSMCLDNLVGATNIDTKVVLATCEEKNISIYITLREVLLTLVAYPSNDDKEKEHCLFAEVHQGGNPGDIVTVVYPNTPAAESLIMSMKKNLAVILQSILIAQGVLSNAINDLLRTSICPSYVAQMRNFTYNENTRTLTSLKLKDNTQDKALEDLAKAPWFQHKFNMDVLLNDKKKAKEDCPPPELLFDLDGVRLLKTIHNKPRKLDKARDATKKKSKIAFEVDSLYLKSKAFSLPKKERALSALYENANGINYCLSNNDKVERARGIHDDLEVDVVVYNKHRLNMKHKSNVNGFNQIFRLAGNVANMSAQHSNVG